MSFPSFLFSALLVGLTLGCAQAANADRLSALAAEPGWHKLLHMEAAGPGSPLRSAVHSDGFFLAGAPGRDDPLAELKATLSALQSSEPVAANTHAQCRFPARWAWLRERLPQQAWPIATCPNWQRFSAGGNLQSLSLVLATGYLGNPASYYGHTLLKFRAETGGGTLRDATVNFGAIVEGQDDPVSYIAKGVFGGYDGGFSEADYYVHRALYGENELRDLWEYELEFTPAEVQRIAAHAWEVLGQRYQYFFFRRNCAFRMAELLEIIDGVGLIPAWRPWTIPQSLLQEAAKGRRPDGKPLIRRTHREPSRQSRFYASYEALDAAERASFHALAEAQQLADDPGFTRLPLASRQAVLDALIDYQLFVTVPAEREAGRMPAMYSAALAERYRLPPGRRASASPEPLPPHIGRRPGWAQVALRDLGGRRLGLLRLRPAYYDTLDTDTAHLPHAALAMGDLQLRWERGGRLRLQQLDLIAIDSVNPGVSGLPGDRGEAWRLRLGVEPQHPGIPEARVLRFQLDTGRGRRLNGAWFAAVYAGGAVQERQAEQGPAFARISARVLWRHRDWAGLLESEQRWPLAARARPYRLDRATLRWAPEVNVDLRLGIEQTSALARWRGVQLGVGLYW